MIGGKKDPEMDTAPPILKPEFKFSAQYSREIMHVRQSNASRVSSFDVIAS